MIQNWKKHLKDTRAEQCLTGTAFLIELVQKLKPSVYVETGCAHLATFELYHSMLPKDGIALGIDIRRYSTWDTYHQTAEQNNYCPFKLIKGSTTPDKTELVNGHLEERPIDFLFIDGDHNEEGVRNDWVCLSPLVRKGGLVVFHDYDSVALSRGHTKGQGAAIICKELEQQGYNIQSIKNTSIGTAYLYK